MVHYDVVVCGLGAMGSAALRELSRRRLRVVGIERFAPGHERGSSHGETRIIRLAYFEHPSYVPLLQRTYELWRELEAACERKLVHITSIAEMGPPEGMLVKGVLASVRMHGLRHELLTAEEVMEISIGASKAQFTQLNSQLIDEEQDGQGPDIKTGGSLAG